MELSESHGELGWRNYFVVDRRLQNALHFRRLNIVPVGLRNDGIMKSMWFILGCVVAFNCFFVQFARAESPKPLTMCLDPGGMDSENRNVSTKSIFSGPRIDIVLEVFRQASIEVKLINDGPWKRCLHDVSLGYVDFAMGAYFDEERAKVFDFSDHYNTLTPSVFFLASKKLNITKVEDLEKLHGCGISGYSYSHYKIQPEKLDWTPDYGSVYRKLISGRCDFLLEELESVVDGENTKQFLHNPLIQHIPANWATAPSSYIITQKNGKSSAALKDFNRSLKIVIKSGRAAKLWKEGMGDLVYIP